MHFNTLLPKYGTVALWYSGLESDGHLRLRGFVSEKEGRGTSGCSPLLFRLTVRESYRKQALFFALSYFKIPKHFLNKKFSPKSADIVNATSLPILEHTTFTVIKNIYLHRICTQNRYL